ncbi:uncharacterized protein ARMOST_04348 [Armillaria ostoyae]|uniref:Ribonuclease H1 N-terminal domain-containing protein n=1 Tax=Armillaria ostoyae TaxID=47428 RepID=A0A284QX86_ARMOS|nr:uncharacterized protein ARMOST_04348 [Armillaria ostoyae]
MASDKGKVPERGQEPASITPEALRVLLDAIQVLTLVQSPAPSAVANSGSDSAAASSGSSNATSSAAMSVPSSSSGNSGPNNGGGTHAGVNVAPTHTGFHCSACGAYNVGQSQAAWYVITTGHQVGVFSSWSLVQPHVTGVAHACFHRYPNQQAARRAYDDALAAGLVRVLP